MPIRFYNSLTRSLEEFQPLREGEVRMYNCGPTVYSSPHIGNFRSFLFADLLRRFLDWRGFQVLQAMNLTDVGHLRDDEVEAGEDKMELASRREKLTVWQIASRYITEFDEAKDFLGIRPAHLYPRATDHIEEMKEMIQTLLDGGYAYVAESGNVYFEVNRFDHYGRLSGNTQEDLLAGARVEVNPEKKDPRDFALWKIDPLHQMKWENPWGDMGFPGWHIECSAMARKYLGDTLDIHTGGEDNVFPHHECEIAQSECATGKPFVKLWMHARHLLVDGKKMSKRDGNFFTIDDLRQEGHSGDAVRLALLRVHYREPLNFTREGLTESARKLQRYGDLQQRLEDAQKADGEPSSATTEACQRARGRFQAALDEDLNISVAMAALDELVAEANRQQPTGADARGFLEGLRELWGVLGLREQAPESRPEEDAEVLALVKERSEARDRRDYARSDEIRDLLHARGLEVKDTKDGPKVVRL